MKILHVVGARPNFVKIAPIMRAVETMGAGEQLLVHTGQHYDADMSRIFFEELGLPEPDVYLGVGSGSHAEQTARAMLAFEPVVLQSQPDWVLVVGDVNSTLAAGLVCSKLGVPVAHVEAGLRSFNWCMPEEVNRVLVDRLSQLLFCPSQSAADHLRNEGITRGVHVVGDVMYDAILGFVDRSQAPQLPADLGEVPSGTYFLATVHRAANTDDPRRLRLVLDCLAAVDAPVIFPVHPRTLKALRSANYTLPGNVRPVEPVGYAAMLQLERGARAIVTDSGGVQKEAFWLGVPCVTLRDETEWTETVESGWNQLVTLDPTAVRTALARPKPGGTPPPVYGDGHAAERIVEVLLRASEAHASGPA